MRLIFPTTAVLSFALLGCGSDSTTIPTPTCTVSAVAIAGGGVSRAVGETVQLTAQVTSSNCTTEPTIIWSAQPTGLITLSASGLVTASAPGVVTITATAGGVSGTTQVTITPAPPAVVRFLVDSVVLGSGDQFTLAAEARTAADQPVPNPAFIWSLLDEGPVTLGAGGQVTAVTEGATARIQVRLGDLTDTARVHVVRHRLALMWNQVADLAGPYDAAATWSWNSGGGINTITRTGIGEYLGTWPMIGGQPRETEAVFVSAYNAAFGNLCNVLQWTASTAQVQCRNATGDAVDGNWTMAVIGNATLRGRSAFAWIQSPTTSASADPEYRHNPTGGDIVSTVLGVGEYRVRFIGLGRQTPNDREAVIVTPYLTNASCQPTSWTTTGADLDVTVRCHDPLGAPVAARFVILVADGARPGAQLAFAVADQPNAIGAYQPTNQGIRPGPGTATVEQIGAGIWDITLPGFFRADGRRETFLVSATGTTTARCSVVIWNYSNSVGNPTTVTVRCGTPGGAPANVPFVLVGLQ
jgi:hypothetical protein